jgi:hypothetical protein
MYYSYIKVLVDAAVCLNTEKVIKCDFKSGTVERSVDLGNYFNSQLYVFHLPTANESKDTSCNKQTNMYRFQAIYV